MTSTRPGPRIAAACLAAGLVAGCAPDAEVSSDAEVSPNPELSEDAAGIDDGPSDEQPDDGPSDEQPDDQHAQPGDEDDTWTFGDDADASDAVPATELPDEIDAAMDVPDSFEQYSRAEASSAGRHQLTVQGEVTGSQDQLLTRIEDSMRAAGWERIELDDLVEDRPILRAEDGDRELEVTVSVADGDDEGALTISYSWRE